MKNYNIHEAKTRLSSLLVTVEQKREGITICRNGKPVADLVPHRKQSRLLKDELLSRIVINYDPTEPLNDEEWGEIE